MTRPGLPLLVRFWMKVDISAGFDGCWLWTGARSHHGYGRIQVSVQGEPRRAALAHRVAWELFNGPIPEGRSACHRCDTPACVNPGHLFLGTTQDNVSDMVAKGRHRYTTFRGESHPRARLSAVQVADIRRLHARGVAGRVLADTFGVGRSQISRIVRGLSWAS